uniref:Uncharacterized protein n=1 Tax=Arundo donax TaxID=35708 RepID=A0A0A9D085_ARUDO
MSSFLSSQRGPPSFRCWARLSLLVPGCIYPIAAPESCTIELLYACASSFMPSASLEITSYVPVRRLWKTSNLSVNIF